MQKKHELLGCYVTGTQVSDGFPRQGVFVKDNYDGTVVVQGEKGRYLCIGPGKLGRVTKLIMESTVKHIEEQRRLIDSGYYE